MAYIIFSNHKPLEKDEKKGRANGRKLHAPRVGKFQSLASLLQK